MFAVRLAASAALCLLPISFLHSSSDVDTESAARTEHATAISRPLPVPTSPMSAPPPSASEDATPVSNIARLEVTAFQVVLSGEASVTVDALELQKHASTPRDFAAAVSDLGTARPLVHIDRIINIDKELEISSTANLPIRGAKTGEVAGRPTFAIGSYQSKGVSFKVRRQGSMFARSEVYLEYELSASSMYESSVQSQPDVPANVYVSFKESSKLRLQAGVPEICVTVDKNDPDQPPVATIIRYVWTPMDK
ncbi:MAG TPA: hypothetical protein VNT79_10885 [Phycisphaerae bacterium]|nr:hypothetical protein [Phycisphaerae bacterium]